MWPLSQGHLFPAEQPKPARERSKTNHLSEVREPLEGSSDWPEPGASFDGHRWSGQRGREFWVGTTVNVKAWVAKQNGGGMGLAQKEEGWAEEEMDESVGYSAADGSKGPWEACEPVKDQLVLMLDQGHHFQGGMSVCGRGAVEYRGAYWSFSLPTGDLI